MKLLVTGGAGVFLSLDFVTISIASKHRQAWPNRGR